MSGKKRVVIGLLGSVLDSGFHEARWKRWRPTISLCQHADLPIDRFELIYDPKFNDTARAIMADIPRVSAATEVRGTTAIVARSVGFRGSVCCAARLRTGL
jgi:transcriptional regulatory protein RtcR